VEQTNINKPRPRAYDKAHSLSSLSGDTGLLDEVLQRLARLCADNSWPGMGAKKNAIVNRAAADLLNTGDTPDESRLKLQPHVIAELSHLSDADIARYLFYRYRYDVYPLTKELDAFPPCVQIEPTSICNYRCVFCYQTDKSFTQGRHGHMGMMDLDTFKIIVDQIEGEVEAVTLASRGEPLMSKNIKDMLAYLQGKFLGLKMNTNAWFLTEEMAHAILATGLNTLVFSADAADAELYARLRVNGKFDRVRKNIEMFHEIRAKHYPESQLITRVSGVKFNDDQKFSDVQSFWSEYVDQVAFVDYNPWENVYLAPPQDVTTPCSDLWRRTFVWWDGTINPCDVDYKSHLAVGNVKNTTVSDAWTGNAYQELRENHLAGRRGQQSPCANCVVV
jgi:radical SAM protein with 4Fe4S-binding SPASM domain